MGYDHISSLKRDSEEGSKLKERVVISNESRNKNVSLDHDENDNSKNEIKSVILESVPLSIKGARKDKPDMKIGVNGEPNILYSRTEGEDANQADYEFVNIEKE